MPRYSDWRRLTGDSDRPDLLDLGKRLLGYLAEQRALSGVTTCSIERSAPDGSLVRARFVGNLPSIEVRAATGTPQGNEPLAGFVTSPTATDLRTAAGSALDLSDWPDNGTNPEVLIGVGKTAYSPRGFSGYRRLFPFGIRQAGNIDWRDSAENWVISYYGPRARYFEKQFGATNHGGVEAAPLGFKPWVIRNGYTVLDLWADAYAAAAADSAGGVIVGAGVRGTDLVYVARKDSTEYAYRVPLAPAAADAGRVGVDLSGLTLIATRAMREGEAFGQASHPWLFNQSGTQARCIRQALEPPYDHFTTYEEVLDLDSASFSSIALGDGRITTITDTRAAGTGSFTNQSQWQAFSIPSDITVQPTAGAWGSNGSGSGVGTYAESVVNNAARFACAVDFIDDVPVYAYAVPPTSSTTSTEFVEVAFTQSNTVYDSARTNTRASSTTGTGRGVQTDFITVIPKASGSTNAVLHGAVALTVGGNAYAGNMGNHDYTGGTFVRQTNATTQTQSADVSVSYMDLRHGWLVYELAEEAQTSVVACDTALALGGVDLDITKTYVETTTTTTTRTVTTRVTKAGLTLYEDVVVQAESNESGDPMPILSDHGFTGSYFTQVETNQPGIIVRICNFDTPGAEGAYSVTAGSVSATEADYSNLLNWASDTLNSDALNFGTRSLRQDQNGVACIGSWQQYSGRWVFSMGLPRSAWEATSFITQQDRWGSGIQGGTLATLSPAEHWADDAFIGKIAPPFELFFPISVVAATRRA